MLLIALHAAILNQSTNFFPARPPLQIDASMLHASKLGDLRGAAEPREIPTMQWRL